MIYAKVDVKLRDHERAHRAGPAMATWTWALLYVVDQETDGYVPDVALRGAWVGEEEALRHAERLVLVGLWEKAEKGWRICKYESKNRTKAVAEAQRKEIRDRVAKLRRNRASNDHGNDGHNNGCNALLTESSAPLVPRSRSHSQISGSGSGSLGGAGGAPPDWFAAAAATASMAGAPTPAADLLSLWVRYQGSERFRQGQTQQGAAAWLVATIKGERRKDAEARRGPPSSGGGPRGDRQPHDNGYLSRLPSGTETDL